MKVGAKCIWKSSHLFKILEDTVIFIIILCSGDFRFIYGGGLSSHIKIIALSFQYKINTLHKIKLEILA